MPILSISSPTVFEGNSGNIPAVFTVTLSQPGQHPIQVDYITLNGSATTQDNDYSSASGTLVFDPGMVTLPVTVTLASDTKFEQDETFTVELNNPISATLAISQTTCTILNDDAQPEITIDPVSDYEKDAGTGVFTFTVSLTNASYQDISVNYASIDGSATVIHSDYLPISGTLSIPSGQLTSGWCSGVCDAVSRQR